MRIIPQISLFFASLIVATSMACHSVSNNGAAHKPQKLAPAEVTQQSTNTDAKEDHQSSIHIEFDTRNAEAVLRALVDKTSLPASFEALPGTRLLVQKGLSREPTLTVPSYRNSIEKCVQGDCRDTAFLRMTDTYAKREAIGQLVSRLSKNSAQFSKEIAMRVGSNVPPLRSKIVVPVRLVLGGRSDGYVEELDGRQEMVIDVRTLLQGSVEATEKQIWALVDHEVWHILFLAYAKENWRISDPAALKDPSYQLVFGMLNEGYGHYMSLLTYAGGDEVKANIILDRFDADSKEPGFSTLFNSRVEEFLVASEARQNELVIESHIADRMGAKWGALTGARIIADLRREIGHTATVNLLRNNTFAFLEAYASVKKPHVKMNKAFQQIILRAKTASNIGKN